MVVGVPAAGAVCDRPDLSLRRGGQQRQQELGLPAHPRLPRLPARRDRQAGLHRGAGLDDRQGAAPGAGPLLRRHKVCGPHRGVLRVAGGAVQRLGHGDRLSVHLRGHGLGGRGEQVVVHRGGHAPGGDVGVFVAVHPAPHQVLDGLPPDALPDRGGALEGQ